MNIIRYPEKSSWTKLLQRPLFDLSSLYEKVRAILDDVKQNGDEALIKYEELFDHIKLNDLAVQPEELEEAGKELKPELKTAIQSALEHIKKFHEAQKFAPIRVETAPGVICEQRSVPISKVGLYIPGGSAPLFSTVLMLAAPAHIAGCESIILCTPPNKEGKINDAILFAAKLTGVNKIYKIGGSQAIAAMAYGTETIPKVDKIFGPGNQFVMAAKQLVALENVAIDMPAGPSEVAVIADDSCQAEFVAADLLSQAEHGPDSQVLLITPHAEIIQSVQIEIDRQLATLPRKDIAEKSLANSQIILVKNMAEAIEITNEYAPEHLIIETKDYMQVAERIVNAGSVFLGPYTPESAGDYASGTNHTLPTNGYAKAYSGVNLDSFMRKITFQEITREGIMNIGPTIETMAANEFLDAHKNAVSVRLK